MSDMALGGLSSLLATIQGLYPKARVTSGYRGPNNPLTQANPRSMHALGSAQDPRAVDVAPIPGVSFDQYVGSIKNAGVPVAQAFDEQKHPFKWTTGPNWHIGVGQAPVQAAYQPRKPRTLGDVMPSPDLAAQVPVNIDSAPVQRQLGDLGGSLPTMETSGHKGLFPGKDWKSILGILADGLTAYGGGQPVFGPALLKRQEQEREQGFDREKLAALIQQKREAAMQPKPPTQTDRYVQEVLDPNTSEPRRALLRQILTHPLGVMSYGSDGSATQNYYYPDQQQGGGEDDWEYSN